MFKFFSRKRLINFNIDPKKKHTILNRPITKRGERKEVSKKLTPGLDAFAGKAFSNVEGAAVSIVDISKHSIKKECPQFGL